MAFEADKSFVELIGFTHLLGWRKFKEDHPNDATHITTNFNNALKLAVHKSKGILIYRKINVDEYNTLKHNIPYEETRIVKHQKTIQSEQPQPQPQRQPQVVPEKPNPYFIKLEQENINLKVSLQNLSKENIQLQKMYSQYKHQLWETTKRAHLLQNRLQDLNQRLFETITDISEITNLKNLNKVI